jgi:hypothetical protein
MPSHMNEFWEIINESTERVFLDQWHLTHKLRNKLSSTENEALCYHLRYNSVQMRAG